MKIYKKTIFTTILFLTCLTNTHAACTQEEINEFKKIEDQYTVKYEFNKTNKKYDIYFVGSQPEKYFYQIYSDIKINCHRINETTKKCIDFPSDIYDIEIIGLTNTCDDVLKTIQITLPEYNKYSEDPLCEGIEEFVLCNPTYAKKIDYDTFVSRVKTYKRTKEKNKQQEMIEKNDNEKNETIEIIQKYIKEHIVSIIIIIIFVVLIIITIIVTAKSIRKSRRLE